MFIQRKSWPFEASSAACGISPMSSLPSICIPRFSLAWRTASKTTCSGVRRKSTRFMDTCTFRCADLVRNGFRGGQIVALKNDVPGDQEISCAHYAVAGGGMAAVACIGREIGVGAAADVFEARALGALRGGLIKEDRDAQFVPDALAR